MVWMCNVWGTRRMHICSENLKDNSTISFGKKWLFSFDMTWTTEKTVCPTIQLLCVIEELLEVVFSLESSPKSRK
jgi:hypothetical protein